MRKPEQPGSAEGGSSLVASWFHNNIFNTTSVIMLMSCCSAEGRSSFIRGILKNMLTCFRLSKKSVVDLRWKLALSLEWSICGLSRMIVCIMGRVSVSLFDGTRLLLLRYAVERVLMLLLF